MEEAYGLLAQQMATLAEDNQHQSAAARKMETTLLEVRDLLEVGKSGLKVLGYIGTAARWITYIAAAVTAVLGAYHALMGDHTPKP